MRDSRRPRVALVLGGVVPTTLTVWRAAAEIADIEIIDIPNGLDCSPWEEVATETELSVQVIVP